MKYPLSESIDNNNHNNRNSDINQIQSKASIEPQCLSQLNTPMVQNKPKSPFKYNNPSAFSKRSRETSDKNLKGYLIRTASPDEREESKKESEIMPIFNPHSHLNSNFNQILIEEITNRRFNPITINKYKDIFKNRYVSENAQCDINISTNNPRLSTQKSVEIKPFIHINKNESPSNIMIHNKLSLHSATDNRNVIKFASFYIQKLQKAILLFNSRRYEDSYRYLITKAILFNEKEFAQLLLITNGFDKSEIGTFLSKEKTPNNNYRVLNEFIHAMNFVDMDFTKAFRFLLRRLNLPQDSGLTLKIIEVFSNCFFNDNQTSGHYLNETSIYLLASTALAINTMFNRTDIVNMKVISKEVFVKMNHTTSAVIAENVYNEIKSKKLDIVYNYTEMFNKRLGRIINAESDEILKTFTNIDSVNDDNTEKENSKDKEKGDDDIDNNSIELKGNEHSKKRKHSDRHLIHLDDIRIGNNEGDELLSFLKTGNRFFKYCLKSSPHFRFVYLNRTESKICWLRLSFCKWFQCPKAISVRDLLGVYIGAGHSQVFDKALISPEFDQYCFTIESSKRTLDLRNDNEAICDKWYRGIKYLIQRNQSSFNAKEVYPSIVNNVKEKVSLIWESEVIPYWTSFRPFLLLKEEFELDKKYVSQKKALASKLQMSTRPKERLINSQTKNDFVYLYIQYGIPTWLRSKIWQILIPNSLNITDGMISKHISPCSHSHSNNNNISMINISQMENDISKLAKDIIHINQMKVSNKLFYDNIIQSTKVFLNMRSDIVYSKNFAYLISIFLLNSESSVEGYKLFYNFLHSKCDFIIKFHLRDEWFIKNRIEFFEGVFRATLPKLFRHFHDFDIATNLFFYNWYEFLFVKYFFKKYPLLLRLWDIFLVKGEVFVFELGIVLLKLLEKRFLNVSDTVFIIHV